MDISRADYIAIGREVFETIGGARERPFEVLSNRMTSFGHVPLVHAFRTHVLRLGRVALDLHEQGLYLEAIPTVRAAFEMALTACWLSDSREADAAIYNEEARQRRALIGDMSRIGSAFQEGAATLTEVDVKSLETIATAQARRFSELCSALHPGGADAYVIYRIMSAYAHPTATLAERYVEKDDDAEAGITLLTDPNQEDDGIWLPMAVASMVWASRALDVMDRDHPQRNYLRDVARRLRIAEMPRLSPAAWHAEQAADRERRRAQWKGPRRKKKPEAPAQQEPPAG